jgi:hypothetical protein
VNIKKEHSLKTRQLKSPRKMSVFGVLGLIILIFCGIGVISAMISNGIKTSDSAKQTTQTAQPSPIGAVVSDAGFSFVVNSFKCGETHIQTSGYVYTYSDAQGQFCRLNITITNNANSANSIGVSAQYLFNSQGQKFDSDSGATATAAEALAGSPLNAEVNPGNSVTGDIVYDIPVGDTPTIAELHGDTGSQGVRIKLQ